MDLQAIDNVFATSSVPFNYKYVDFDEMDTMNENIKDQYINLNNLGINILKEIKDNDIKATIIIEMIQFINDNYTSVVNFESLFVRDTEQIGGFIYEFFCVDTFNILIPKLITTINCNSRQEFEFIVNKKIKTTFKNKFILIIKNYLDQLFKLSNIDPKIKNDSQYNNIIKKFSYYIDLIEFGLQDQFVENYIFPLVNKHFEELTWRSN